MITIGIILCFILLLIDLPLFAFLGELFIRAIKWAWPLWLSILGFIIGLSIDIIAIAMISLISILLCLPLKAAIEAIIQLVKKGK